MEREFDFYQEGKRYEELLLEHGPIEIPGYAEMAAKVDALETHVVADAAGKCLNHNDFFALNFLIDEHDKYYLIDWEYAGMSDYANDFGTFCVCCQLDEDEVDLRLSPTSAIRPRSRKRGTAWPISSSLAGRWYLWALLKEAEGDHVGEWLYIYYSYADKYLDRVLAMYEG